MLDSFPQACIVFTTTSTVAEAEDLSRTIIEENLAACATILPGAKSIYLWKNVVETATEAFVILKTIPEKLPALEARVHAIHRYQTPEFLVLHADVASASYIEWLSSSLKAR